MVVAHDPFRRPYRGGEGRVRSRGLSHSSWWGHLSRSECYDPRIQHPSLGGEGIRAVASTMSTDEAMSGDAEALLVQADSRSRYVRILDGGLRLLIRLAMTLACALIVIEVVPGNLKPLVPILLMLAFLAGPIIARSMRRNWWLGLAGALAYIPALGAWRTVAYLVNPSRALVGLLVIPIVHLACRSHLGGWISVLLIAALGALQIENPSIVEVGGLVALVGVGVLDLVVADEPFLRRTNPHIAASFFLIGLSVIAGYSAYIPDDPRDPKEIINEHVRLVVGIGSEPGDLPEGARYYEARPSCDDEQLLISSNMGDHGYYWASREGGELERHGIVQHSMDSAAFDCASNRLVTGEAYGGPLFVQDFATSTTKLHRRPPVNRPGAGRLYLAPDQFLVWECNEGGEIRAYDLDAGRASSAYVTSCWGLAPVEHGRTLVSSGSGDLSLWKLESDSMEVSKVWEIAVPQPRWPPVRWIPSGGFVDVIRDGSKAYVISMADGTVTKIDWMTQEVLAASSLTVGVRFGALAPSGEMLAISDWPAGEVVFVDTANLSEVARFSVGRLPRIPNFSRSGDEVFVATKLGVFAVSVPSAKEGHS